MWGGSNSEGKKEKPTKCLPGRLNGIKMLSTNTTESSKLDPTTHLDWALKYAKMGLRVFPLQPGTKIPMTAHGVKDATDDPALIKEWWTKRPGAGIGLAARAERVGAPSFLEFDQKQTLKDWARNEGEPDPSVDAWKSYACGCFTTREESEVCQ
jgi:hypothetical protein